MSSQVASHRVGKKLVDVIFGASAACAEAVKQPFSATQLLCRNALAWACQPIQASFISSATLHSGN